MALSGIDFHSSGVSEQSKPYERRRQSNHPPGHEGYVSEPFALEAERGKGIGGALIDEAKRLGRERGCRRLRPVTGKGREAYRIYPGLGWKERPEIADFVLPLQ